MFRRRTKSQLISVGLAFSLILMSVLPSQAMAATAAQQKQAGLTQAIQSAGTTSYSLNSKAYLESALDTLQPYASDKPGPGVAADDLSALRADLGTAFFDVSRVAREPALDRALNLTQEVYAGYNNGAVPDQAALTALTDLLLTLRQAAEAALTDAKVFAGYQGGAYPDQAPTLPGYDAKKWTAAMNSLRQAETAYDTALEQLQLGNAEAGGRHFLIAWQKATGGMASLGLTFQPGQVTDLDGDGVPDQLEVRYGASPLNKDSDGDGLTDAFEIYKGGATFLPASRDTNNNGIPDGDEDSDRDGLTNLYEQALGTDPLRADTDNDDLKDGAEGLGGSNPLLADADKDGLNDAAERRVGTNPNNPDTDGDGILDGQDLLTGTVESPIARVTVTGTGDVAGTVSIRSLAAVTALQGMAGLVGSVTQVTATLPFVSAKVELPVSVAQVPNGDISNLRMMYFDEAASEWRQVEGAQGYDPATGRFWAETTHFTAFAVFYIPSWDDFWTVEACGDQGEAPEYIDVALVLDSSGSMSWNDPDGLRLVGAKRLVDGLLDQDRAAVIDFDDYGRVWAPLTSDKAALYNAIDMVDSWGGTNLAWGMYLGLVQLINSPDDRGRIMVLMTDGVGYYSQYYTDVAVQMNVSIYTIGLGWDIDIPLLESIASQTGGKFYHVENAADLPDVFQRVGQEVGERDTDRDTLTNCEEINGMFDVNGKKYTSDKENVDTDGDGLTDDEEMGQPVGGAGAQSLGLTRAAANLSEPDRTTVDPNAGFDQDEAAFKAHVKALNARPASPMGVSIQSTEEPRTFRVESDPRLFDTDGDGLDDAAEVDNGTPRLNPDWDGDGLNDYEELVHGTAPDISDTDGDGFNDAYEVAHLTDGFDPLVQDEHMTPEEWGREFAAGLAAGDACDTWLSGWTPCRGTIPFFLGQLSGGATSFIPVVGWIIGGIADLRDAIGNAIKGEWVGAGLSLIGIIPDIGDVGKIAGKVADFVSKFGKLEGLLRAVLRIMFKVVGSANLSAADLPTGQFDGYLAISGSGPPIRITSANPAIELVMEVLRKVDPAGFRKVAEFGDEAFLAKLAVAGAKWADLGKIFSRIQDTGLFREYPKMQEFISDMIKATPDDALYGAGDLLTLNGRVTLNIKKAAARIATGDESMIGIMSQHLRGALAEHRSYAALTGTDLIPVSHVTARGPDRVFRSASGVVDVLESKAMTTISRSNIKKWLIKRVETVDGIDKTIYEFNGDMLNRYLIQAGQPDLATLLSGNSLRYNLFQYDQAGSLTSELAGLFNGSKIPIKGFDGAEIQLIYTPFFP